jgi:VIT1/CCC1 family predicted Fe2+/Mn2+ transporter
MNLIEVMFDLHEHFISYVIERTLEYLFTFFSYAIGSFIVLIADYIAFS